MSSSPDLDQPVRDAIIAKPDAVLEDQDVMRALIAANERMMGENIVDLRSIAMERLEARLDRLEDTHRGVIAAAYENLSGTNQVHRAILRMLDPVEFDAFLRDLDGEVAEILRVDAVRLVLESAQSEDEAEIPHLGDVLRVADPGFVDDYLTQGRGGQVRPVTLRTVDRPRLGIFGDRSAEIGSEACLRLDFGPGRLPGLLIMGAADPGQFTAQQGTDLLGFFAGVFERSMRRWLS